MLDCYTSKFSYFNNELVNLKINSSSDLYSIKIYKFNTLEIIYTDFCKEQKIYKQKINESKFLFIDGYNYITNYTIDLNNYNSGLYFIEIKNNDGNEYFLPINIKNKDYNCKNLVLLNSNTWNAYNEAGGASFYRYYLDFKSEYGPLGKKIPSDNIGVTFDRPFDKLSDNISFFIKNDGEIKEKYDHLFYGELRLLKFMELNNIKYDLLDDLDLHNNLIDLSKYNNFILNCHPEYWSVEMLKNVKENANHIISFAGNVAYRKVIYKNNKIYGRVGCFSSDDLKNITGSFYSSSGADTYAPYKIFDNKHILFQNINNDVFGKNNLNNYKRNVEDGISGHETDKKIKSVNTNIIASGLNRDKNISVVGGGGDILYFSIKKDNSSNIRNILSVGSIVFTGGLFIDKDTEIFCKNVFSIFNAI
jgi:hypothetical protein